MAGIGQLDADRAAVDVAQPSPEGLPGMPGALALIDQPVDRAGFVDQPMAADLGGRIAQPLQSRLGARHAGIMDQQDIDRTAHARPVIGRGALDPAGHASSSRFISNSSQRSSASASSTASASSRAVVAWNLAGSRA